MAFQPRHRSPIFLSDPRPTTRSTKRIKVPDACKSLFTGYLRAFIAENVTLKPKRASPKKEGKRRSEDDQCVVPAV